MVLSGTRKSFIKDKDKMREFFNEDKNDFLNKHDFLTEQEYEETVKDVIKSTNYLDKDILLAEEKLKEYNGKDIMSEIIMPDMFFNMYKDKINELSKEEKAELIKNKKRRNNAIDIAIKNIEEYKKEVTDELSINTLDTSLKTLNLANNIVTDLRKERDEAIKNFDLVRADELNIIINNLNKKVLEISDINNLRNLEQNYER